MAKAMVPLSLSFSVLEERGVHVGHVHTCVLTAAQIEEAQI